MDSATNPRNQQDTRERILDSAEKLFAERGYAGASVRTITADACCNLASVNYYFGSKHKLYVQVFMRRMSEISKHRRSSFRAGLSNRRGAKSLSPIVRAFAKAFLEPLAGDRTGRLFVQIMSWEMADPRLPAGMLKEKMFDPIEEVLREALMEVCAGLDAKASVLCTHSIVSQLLHMLKARHTLGGDDLEGLPGFSEEQFLNHVISFSAHGIQAYSKGKIR